jgi:hypothetical protein
VIARGSAADDAVDAVVLAALHDEIGPLKAMLADVRPVMDVGDVFGARFVDCSRLDHAPRVRVGASR